MKIRYAHAYGKVIELDVSTEVGTFYLAAVEAEKKNDRRNMRPDRHTPLSAFDYEGSVFDAGVDVATEALRRIEAAALNEAIARLSPRQRELVSKVYFEGRSLVSIAADEGVGESAIRDRMKRICKKLKKHLE